ncbi:MAG: enoyl-CoA hydratase-related protein [Vicinamibacteria bacterium]
MTTAPWTLETAPTGVATVRVATDEEPWLGPDFMERWDAVARAAEHDDAIRVVVVEGGTRHFCAGARLDSLTAADAPAEVSSYASVLPERLLAFPLPTVAAMAGHAVGGGLLVGLWCDAAFFAEESLYGANFTALGFTPGMGSTAVLEDAFGGPLAREMLYTGRLLKGRELAEAGCRRFVAPRAQVTARAHALAEEMARTPRATLLELRRMVCDRRRDQLGEALRREAEAHRRVFALPGTARAIAERYPAGPGEEGA